MINVTRRSLAAVSATLFAAAGIGLAAPATASATPQVKVVTGAQYLAFDDLADQHFDAIDRFADQINDIIPGEEEVVFAVNKRGPRSAVGIWDPARSSQNSLMVECDPEVDSWESFLAGSCSGNEESLLSR